MDFVIGLPRSLRGNNSIWVIVDQLTKYVHFLPMKVNFSLERLTYLYRFSLCLIETLVSLSRFWRSLHKALGTKLIFSTAFHP